MVDLLKGKNAIGLKWVFNDKVCCRWKLTKAQKVMHNSMTLILKKHFLW